MTKIRKAVFPVAGLGGWIGLLNQEPEKFLRGSQDEQGLSADEIDTLIEQRNQARAAKDWAESDRIRDVLKEQGIVLEDSGGQTTWRRD